MVKLNCNSGSQIFFMKLPLQKKSGMTGWKDFKYNNKENGKKNNY